MSILLFLLALQPQDELKRVEDQVAAVAERCRKSVVAVVAERKEQDPVELSGVIYSADGVIVTDASGLEKDGAIKVKLPDGRELEARLIGSDRITSLAVLRVDADKLTPAEFADAKDQRPGSYAIVVGNPLGMKGSVAIGFISGLGRSIRVGGRKYGDMMQMSTAVNAGDCGAGVANAAGKLVGLVHSACRGEPDALDIHSIMRLLHTDFADRLPGAGGGLSFATPASTVRFVADRIVKHGRMVRGRMGLTVRPIDDATREQFSIAAGEGCQVISVDPKGPAAKVLQHGDVLLSVDGRAVTDLRALKKWVVEHEQAASVKVVFLRGGKRQEAGAQVVVGQEDE